MSTAGRRTIVSASSALANRQFTARRDDASYPDLVREAVVLAMKDAELSFDDIQAVVYSLSPDAMVGIGNAERLGVDAVGGRNKRVPAHQHRRRHRDLQRLPPRITTSRPASATSC